MRLPALTDGRIERRYQRFLADVVLEDGRRVQAHVPNTGSMATCWHPGAPVQLTHNDDPRRRLRWTLERVDAGNGWVGVHTGRPNQVMAEAIAAGRIASLAGYGQVRREVPFAALDADGHSHKGRLDLGLGEGAGADALVEVKNVTLLDGRLLRFPDARSERARKHLSLLVAAVRQGLRGVMLFALNRPEGACFAPAWGIDPAYGEALLAAADAGVEVLAVRMEHQAEAIVAGESVPLMLEPPAAP